MARRFGNLNLGGRKYEYKNKRSTKKRNSIAVTLEELTKGVFAFKFGPDDMWGELANSLMRRQMDSIQKYLKTRTVN